MPNCQPINREREWSEELRIMQVMIGELQWHPHYGLGAMGTDGRTCKERMLEGVGLGWKVPLL